MAMVEASRMSELQALDYRYRCYQPESVVLRAPPKKIMFGAFPEDSVIKCLWEYEEATAQYRKMDSQPLFLSYIKPQHGPVTSQ